MSAPPLQEVSQSLPRLLILQQSQLNTTLPIAPAGIWTNTVPDKIREYMGNDTLATQAYANPFGFANTWEYGTPERMAVAKAHDEAQVSNFFLARATGIGRLNFATRC